ncbi:MULTISPECIES: c-type cytochrome [Spirosoma]|uniref:Cytochrome c n=1 Tax=Spirosoma sordidisoli TaxID=2502893 RepID=A0A4Q2UR23_9BACT|nr:MULTISPECIES: cytochrome c [Spirosoma]RYC70271.1 cytochrome c [Spirosoma sordidisoli]
MTIRLGLYATLAGLLTLASCQSDEEIKRQKYITEGILLYKSNCANCHQADGKGVAALYPPLAGSDYLANKDKVICLIKYGLNGPIVVNGKRYNRPMPAQLQLSDLEVAEITTYIYNEWGKETGLTSVTAVTPILKACETNAQQNPAPASAP